MHARHRRRHTSSPPSRTATTTTHRHHHQVNLTPGATLGCDTPGWFRLCFAARPVHEAFAAAERVVSYLRCPGGRFVSGFWKVAAPAAIPSKATLHRTFEAQCARLSAERRAEAGGFRLLDLGCGNGNVTASLAGRHGAAVVVGVDINAAAIASAALAHGTVASGAQWFVGDCRTVQVASGGGGGHDVVLLQLMISVIGDRKDRLLLLANAARHLAPGGVVLLSASADSADVSADYRQRYLEDEPLTG